MRRFLSTRTDRREVRRAWQARGVTGWEGRRPAPTDTIDFETRPCSGRSMTR
jgi:hypothetical protein